MISFFKNFVNKLDYVLIYLILTQLMSVRFFVTTKFISQNEIFIYISYITLSIFLYLLLKKNKLIQIFKSKFFFILFLITLFICLLFLYPIAENMKINNLGIDQDNCIKEMLRNFVNFSYPYQKSYLGNPCSTGPFITLLYIPYLFIGDYYFVIINIVFIYLFYFLINQNLNLTGNLLFYITFINLVNLELLSAGTDFFVIGVLYAVYIYVLSLNQNNKIIYIVIFLSTILFYGSRIMFLIAFPIILFITYKKNSYTNNLIHIISYTFVLLIYFILWHYGGEDFHPSHLIFKTFYFLNNLSYKFLFFLPFLIFLPITLKNHYILLPFIMIIPMFIFSILGVFDPTFQLSTWETLNYFTIALPTICIFLNSNHFLAKR